MGDGHKLICHLIDEEHSFWELSTTGVASSPFGKLVADKRNRNVAVNLINQVKEFLITVSKRLARRTSFGK